MSEFRFVGGEICLDLINTVDWEGESPVEAERLADYEDLISWAAGAGSLDRTEAAGLRKQARGAPGAAREALQEALEVRALFRRMALAVVKGEPPRAGDLAGFNRRLSEALSHRRIAVQGSRLVRAWEPADDLHRPLWPAFVSLADLLVSPELRYLKECGGARCGWMYVDRSRPRARRWCEMSTCGNRAKARRHYHRGAGSGHHGE
ncbi:MAG: ABATE domain-containing protein [Gemmatimonadales bacterium]